MTSQQRQKRRIGPADRSMMCGPDVDDDGEIVMGEPVSHRLKLNQYEPSNKGLEHLKSDELDSGISSGVSSMSSGIGSIEYDNTDSSKSLEHQLHGLHLTDSNQEVKYLESIPDDEGYTEQEEVIIKASISPVECPKVDCPFVADDDGDNELHIAIYQMVDDQFLLPYIRRLIKKANCPQDLDLTNNMLQTPLILAALTKKPKICRLLLIAGARPDIVDRNGNSALAIACHNGDLASVKALTIPVLDKDFHELVGDKYSNPAYEVPQNLNVLNYEGYAPLHLAYLAGYQEIVIYLIRRLEAYHNIKTGKAGETLLHMAIRTKSIDDVAFCLGPCCVHLEEPNYSDMTPVNLATVLGLPDIVALLVNAGADHTELDCMPTAGLLGDNDNEMDDDFTFNGDPISVE